MEGSSDAKNQLDSFSRFDRTPTCDRQIQTDRHRPTASTADAQHRAVKTGSRQRDGRECLHARTDALTDEQPENIVSRVASTGHTEAIKSTYRMHLTEGLAEDWQPTAGFMTHVTCRLTAKNRDQLRNHTLGNQVWATFKLTFTECMQPGRLPNVADTPRLMELERAENCNK